MIEKRKNKSSIACPLNISFFLFFFFLDTQNFKQASLMLECYASCIVRIVLKR